MPVIVLVADGARLDAFSGDLSEFPALRRMRDEGGVHPVTSVFPTVTGPAYTPFLVGRFPAEIGVPGIRWYDRARTACSWPDYARSYVGIQFGKFNDDLDPRAPTIFELVPNSIAALSVVTRGLPAERRLGTLTLRSAARVALTHFRGRAEHWLDVDREVEATIPQRMRDERPDFLFAAFTGVDKASHARGHEGPLVREALGIVDATVAQLRADAERGGWWEDTHLWIVSDHGHSPVREHEDLAGLIAERHRTVAHPWSAGIAPEVAVMVSGNAMAHVYVEPGRRERRWWPELAPRWGELVNMLTTRASVDLVMVPFTATRVQVRSAMRGTAFVSRTGDEFRYERESGDPLGYGADISGSADDTFDAVRESDYPDGIVQILSLAGAPRSGDIVLSATPGCDFRAKYEPIPHRSAHGELHRDHMIVPLLMNRPPRGTPRRTTDVFASALAALGVPPPARLDGRSFV
ncbi:MAG: alkaline phosphatase family protein [Gemmatimonadaceae bacterium]